MLEIFEIIRNFMQLRKMEAGIQRFEVETQSQSRKREGDRVSQSRTGYVNPTISFDTVRQPSCGNSDDC